MYKEFSLLYKESSLKKIIKERLLSQLELKNSELLISQLKFFKSNFHSTSRYKKEKNHASIFFQSVGKNSFITVLFKNRLIFNKSLGQLKIDNVKIKKKEKKMIRNLFSFSMNFTNTFFSELQKKYKIKSISVNYNCKPSTYYPFKKHFFYRLIGTFIRKNRAFRRVSFSKMMFKEIQERMDKFKNKWYNPYKDKQKIWNHVNVKNLISRYSSDQKLVRLKSINFINKYPYNGCKKKKMRKL